MLTVLVGAVLGIAIPQLIADDWWDRIFGAFAGLLIGGMVCALLGLLVAGVIGSGKPQKQVVSEKHQLISLQDAAGIHGSFVGTIFLATGHVDSTIRIYYYESTPDGYQLHWMNEDDSTVFIQQENRTDGELDVVTNAFQNASDGKWGILSGAKKYIFHIPNGSITTCFQLSAGTASSSCSGS